METVFQNSCVHTKYKSQTLLVLIMLSCTFHKSVTCFTWLHPDDVTIILHTLLYRSANSTSVQCIASSRGTTCAGPVVFTIDIAVVKSLTNFTYTDNPQVYALVHHNIIRRYIENVCYDARKCTIPVIVL